MTSRSRILTTSLPPPLRWQLAQVYGVAGEDLPAGAQPEVVSLVQQLLGEGGTAGSGIALLLQFPALQPYFEPSDVLEDLVVRGQLASACMWAEALGRERQASGE